MCSHTCDDVVNDSSSCTALKVWPEPMSHLTEQRGRRREREGEEEMKAKGEGIKEERKEGRKCIIGRGGGIGVSRLCSKIYLLCYAALLQKCTYYTQQMSLLCSDYAH